MSANPIVATPDRGARLGVAALSLDIATGDVAENLRRARAMLQAMPAGTDVALLPELFTTSFMKDTDSMLALAEYREGHTMEVLRGLAAEFNVLLAGTFLTKASKAEGGHDYFNTGFLVLPDGETHFYNKHHLFCLSKEAKVLTHGHKRPPVVAFRGWNISMVICYELRFPVWNRNVGNATDLLLIPANWPDDRSYAWRNLIKARAIENQVAVVGCDRSGSDDYGSYTGLAMITDELGRVIAPVPAEAPEGCPPAKAQGIATATPYGPVLSTVFWLGDLLKSRNWMPTDRDADSFCFK